MWAWIFCFLAINLVLDNELACLAIAGTLSSFMPDSASVASGIKYHAEFTPSFSPEKFELSKAYFATAESVRDTLIINWNTTYAYYEKMNAKQAYYMSMEYLQVHSGFSFFSHKLFSIS